MILLSSLFHWEQNWEQRAKKKLCSIYNIIIFFISIYLIIIICLIYPTSTSKSFSTSPIGLTPKLSTITFATFGDRNAGSVGPR